MTDEFANLLSNEEKEILAKNSAETSKGSKIGGVDSQYTTDQLDKWFQTSEDGDKSLARQAKDLEAYNAELAASAERLGTTTSALKLYASAMQGADDSITELTAETAKLAAEDYKFNKSYNKTREAFETNEEAFDQYVKALKSGKKVSYDVADAAGAVVDALADMGVILTSNDLKDAETLENIKTLLNGTEEEAQKAYEALYELSQLNVLKNFFGDSDALLEKYKTIVDGINNTEVGKNLTGDAQQELADLLSSANLTASQIAELGSQLEITIPVKYDESQAATLALKETEFSTAAQSVVHRYDGTMMAPDGKGGFKPVEVDYKWVETTEARTDTILTPDTTNVTVNKNKKNLGTKNFTKSTSGNKGGGGKSKPQEVEHVEDKPDRYHDVNVELKKLSNTLEKLNSQMDKFTGKTKLDNLKKQFQLIGDEVDKYNEKINIARSEMDELQTTLSYNGVKFNADGTIANYTEVFQQEVNRRNADIDWWNSLTSEQQEEDSNKQR